jgi:hypothetical protein
MQQDPPQPPMGRQVYPHSIASKANFIYIAHYFPVSHIDTMTVHIPTLAIRPVIENMEFA